MKADIRKLIGRFPLSIYGHKAALLEPILQLIPQDTEVFCDLFGGTGVVGYAVKKHRGARIIINDIMRFAHLRQKVLVANNGILLSDDDLTLLCSPNPHSRDDVSKMFSRVYGQENAGFLDRWASNIPLLPDPDKRDVAIFLPAVATLVKAEYAAIHFTRMGTLTGYQPFCNISMRDEIVSYATRILPTLIIDNGEQNKAFNEDAVGLVERIAADVLYVDSPYVCRAGRYEEDLAFFDDLVQLLSGNASRVLSPFDGNADLPPYNRFTRRDAALLGFWQIFRAANNVPLVIISYNTTSGLNVAEIENIAKANNRNVETILIPRPRPTCKKGGLAKTEEALVVCRRQVAQESIAVAYEEREAA